MKKELDEDYDISVLNMTNIKPEQAKGDFKFVKDQLFYDHKGNKHYRDILVVGCQDKQIFAMSDGTFIMEDCPEGNQGDIINYYYSDNLDDLTK